MVSDPWEVGTECGVGPFSGTVADYDTTRVLVVLDKPIVYRGGTYGAVVGRPRHSTHLDLDLLATSDVPMNLVLYLGCVSLAEDGTAPGFGATGSIRGFRDRLRSHRTE